MCPGCREDQCLLGNLRKRCELRETISVIVGARMSNPSIILLPTSLPRESLAYDGVLLKPYLPKVSNLLSCRLSLRLAFIHFQIRWTAGLDRCRTVTRAVDSGRSLIWGTPEIDNYL
jgi:hypothetical protein